MVQFYVRDKVGRITRPVRELKGFKKVELAPGEKKVVSFSLAYEDLMYYDNEGRYAVEAGEVILYVGKNSATPRSVSIEIE